MILLKYGQAKQQQHHFNARPWKQTDPQQLHLQGRHAEKLKFHLIGYFLSKPFDLLMINLKFESKNLKHLISFSPVVHCTKSYEFTHHYDPEGHLFTAFM